MAVKMVKYHRREIEDGKGQVGTLCLEICG